MGQRILQIALLIAGALVVLTTSEPVETQSASDTWSIFNRFDGETVASVDQERVLAIRHTDFEETGDAAGARTRRAIETINLHPEARPL